MTCYLEHEVIHNVLYACNAVFQKAFLKCWFLSYEFNYLHWWKFLDVFIGKINSL